MYGNGRFQRPSYLRRIVFKARAKSARSAAERSASEGAARRGAIQTS